MTQSRRPGSGQSGTPNQRLVLSKRQAAKLLGIDRGRTLTNLISAGKLRVVPWNGEVRIPLAEVERIAREGFTLDGKTKRPKVKLRPGVQDPDALRDLDVEKLGETR